MKYIILAVLGVVVLTVAQCKFAKEVLYRHEPSDNFVNDLYQEGDAKDHLSRVPYYPSVHMVFRSPDLHYVLFRVDALSPVEDIYILEAQLDIKGRVLEGQIPGGPLLFEEEAEDSFYSASSVLLEVSAADLADVHDGDTLILRVKFRVGDTVFDRQYKIVKTETWAPVLPT